MPPPPVPQRGAHASTGRPLLRAAFVLGGFVAFAMSFPTLIPAQGRAGNVTALCACVGLALAGELMRGVMLLTNIRGHRVLLPVTAVATVTAFVAVVAGVPGGGTFQGLGSRSTHIPARGLDACHVSLISLYPACGSVALSCACRE